jgi:tetratricopeptide (TPR) repeat protein
MAPTPIIQCSRRPAAAVLLATGLIGLVYLRVTTAESPDVEVPGLPQLEVAIADADAGLEVWQLYAQRLQQAGRLAHAAAAYQRVLEFDPFHHTANLQCAIVLAQRGDADVLYEFMSRLLLADPRLTQDILGRPVAQRYLSADRFQSLLAQARVQSMD